MGQIPRSTERISSFEHESNLEVKIHGLLETDIIGKATVFLHVVTECQVAMCSFLLCHKHCVVEAEVFAASKTPIL